MDGPNRKPGSGKPDARKIGPKIGRAERLAEALRENLRKRKDQSRARSRTGGGAVISESRPENDTDSSEKR